MPSKKDSPSDAFLKKCTFESLFRFKWTALSTLFGILLLTAAFLFIRDRSYPSVGRVFVRIGRESLTVDPTALASGQMISIQQSQDREIQSVMDILASRVLYEDVVDSVGPKQILDFEAPGDVEETSFFKQVDEVGEWVGARISDTKDFLAAIKLADPQNVREDAIELLTESVKISSEEESNVVSISVKAESPLLAQLLAEKMIEGLLRVHMVAHRTPGSMEFFQTQNKRVKSELDSAITQLRDAKSAGELASVHGQRAVLESRLLKIEQDLIVARAELGAAAAKSESMAKTLESLPDRTTLEETTGLTNTARDAMRAELYRVELSKANLESRYTDQHPLRSQMQQQIDLAKQVYGKESDVQQRKTGINETHRQINLALLLEEAGEMSHRARVAELTKLISEVKDEIRGLNDREVVISDLERDIAVLDANYRRYSDNLEQTRIEKALERGRLSSVNVIQRPTFSDAPVDFSNTILAIAGALFALLCAPLATFAKAFFRSDLSTSEDVERELGIPVLITIPSQRKQRITVR